MSTKTYMAKPGEVEKNWYVIDVAGKPLGRVATQIAHILRGKHKPTFTPHVDTGDYVVVINAEKVALTGKKASQKMYYWHTGYAGGIKKRSFEDMINRKPEQVVYLAVKRMLPQNRLGRAMLKKLKVYRGGEHPHEAQKPVEWNVMEQEGKEG